ncbi:MAG: hypothetical protein ABI837_12330, partial [Acidobacteriota bacterium]
DPFIVPRSAIVGCVSTVFRDGIECAPVAGPGDGARRFPRWVLSFVFHVSPTFAVAMIRLWRAAGVLRKRILFAGDAKIGRTP